MRAVKVLIASVVAFGVAVPSAAADGLHLIADDPRYAWSGGCEVDWSVDAGVDAEFGALVPRGLAMISEHTGFVFSQVPAGQGRLRFTLDSSLPQGVLGLGATDGQVQLAPRAHLIGWENEPQIAEIIALKTVIHEGLHTFGLGHDDDEGQAVLDEIMGSYIQPTETVEFGAGDLEGMAYLADLNGCTPGSVLTPTPADQAPDASTPDGSTPDVSVPAPPAPDVDKPKKKKPKKDKPKKKKPGKGKGKKGGQRR